MNVIFVRRVRGRLQLESGVRDAKLLQETSLQRVKNLRGVASVKALAFYNDVRRKCRGTRSEGPSVQVVDVKDVLDLDQPLAYVAKIQILRGALKKYSS